MPPQENIPTRMANPGDLTFAGQAGAVPNTVQTSSGPHTFADFSADPSNGVVALVNDIQTDINKNPNQTLDQWAGNYAPESDGNDPVQYALNIANATGSAPNAPIGSLKSQIAQWATEVGKLEGYQPQGQGVGGIVNSNTGSQIAQTVNSVPGGAATVAGGAGLLGGALALGGDALAGGEGLLSDIGGIAGDVGGAVGKLFGGGQQQTPQPDQATPAPEVNLGATPNESGSAGATMQSQQQPPSETYNTLQSMLGSMVGGQQVMQEGQNRGIDPVSVLEQSGAASALQPDEDGNVNKVGATNLLTSQISQDKGVQTGMVQGMTTPVNLDEAQARAESEINSAMADSGERGRALKEVGRIFDDYRSEQPVQKDEQGNPRLDDTGNPVKSGYILPARYQKKKDLLSVSERDFAKPAHERAAATHVKESMRKHLSEIAKNEGVQGWDETNRRMEALLLAKKAVKKLPKKVQRNKGKEFVKDLAASLAGGAVGKLLGNGTAGAIAGHLIERQLGKKEYKKIGSKKEQEEAEKRSKQAPQHTLRVKPRKK